MRGHGLDFRVPADWAGDRGLQLNVHRRLDEAKMAPADPAGAISTHEQNGQNA